MNRLLKTLLAVNFCLLLAAPVVLDVMHASPWAHYFTALMLMLCAMAIFDAAARR